MHDPMVVAWEVPAPLPCRVKWRDARPGQPRWTLGRERRTNEANRGEPCYPWYRPTGWRPRVAGRAFGLYRLATIWHVEPNDADSGTVCKHWADGHPLKAWRWHVWHWRVQIMPLQSLRARLFDRCAECGRKGRPNVSHQWDGKRLGWWKFTSREGLYHRECSALVSYRRTVETDKALIRHLIAAYRVETDETEIELVERLTDPKSRGMEFALSYRLTNVLGYERGDNYQLVTKGGEDS